MYLYFNIHLVDNSGFHNPFMSIFTGALLHYKPVMIDQVHYTMNELITAVKYEWQRH